MNVFANGVEESDPACAISLWRAVALSFPPTSSQRLSDFPADINNELASKPDDIVCFGGSCIVGPMGNVLAGPDFTGESILFADLDLADVARAKYDFDVTGHYARPDLFHLEINEHPPKPVVSIRRDTETTA